MSEIARKFREVAEPIAASIYFAPEAQEEYKKLDLSFLPGYFCSRSAPLGPAPGEVVASIFAVFNPEIVVPSVKEGWQKTTPQDILQARLKGASLCLERLLGTDLASISEKLKKLCLPALESAPKEGHPLFAGLIALELPSSPSGVLFRICDLIREHRGDSHTIAWTSKGISGCEISLLSESYWGIPPRSYIYTRGWSQAQVDQASEHLKQNGLLNQDETITEQGRALREEIETLTDEMERPIIEKIKDVSEVINLLEPLAKTIIDKGGFPANLQNLGKTLRNIN